MFGFDRGRKQRKENEKEKAMNNRDFVSLRRCGGNTSVTYKLADLEVIKMGGWWWWRLKRNKSVQRNM